MEELEPEHEPVFEVLDALEPAAGIGGIVLRLVGPAELDEQLDPTPPELANVADSPVPVRVEAKDDDEDNA